jgi:hypothetical protein
MGGLGWVLLLASWVGLGWVCKLVGWVGLGEEKWTHVHLCTCHQFESAAYIDQNKLNSAHICCPVNHFL